MTGYPRRSLRHPSPALYAGCSRRRHSEPATAAPRLSRVAGIVVATTLAVSAAAFAEATGFEDGWPQWRGPNSTGVVADASPPLTWSETENVRWKVAVPGRGQASPIVWRDRVYLLTAVEPGSPEIVEDKYGGLVQPTKPIEFTVLAISRHSGDRVWQKVANTAVPHEGTHATSTWASASAATDGEVLVAHFGSNGTFGFDLDGKLLWKHDFGDQETMSGFGEGSSPAMHGDTVVVSWDHGGDDFVVALDKRTGKVRWRRERDEPTSWSSPLVFEAGGKAQVVLNAKNRVRAYDLKSGKELWSVSGMTPLVIPTPSYANGLVYLMSGYRDSRLMAIRPRKASGNLDGTEAIAWRHERDASFLPSGLAYGDSYFFLKTNNGILTHLDATTGEVRFGPVRLKGIGDVYASPVGAAGRIYITDRDGTTLVLKKSDQLEVLATNTLDEGFDASPAIAGKQLFLRGRRHLYCLEED